MLPMSSKTGLTTLSNRKNKSKPSAKMYHPLYAQVIDRITAVNKNFKYIIHVILVARGGNGLDMGGLTYWNPEMDGSVKIKW